MRRPARIHRSPWGKPPRPSRPIFASLTLACIGVVWWGCSPVPDGQTTGTNSTGHGGASGSGGAGGIDVHFDGGGGGSVEDAGSCTSTSAEAHRIPLDIIFLIDRSGSMHYGGRWAGTTSALTAFFSDPASTGIGAGMVYFPSLKADSCDLMSYVKLDVPIDVLPTNAFALTNSMPADATGYGTPTYIAVKGALITATAYQDAHPTHKVILVLATDGAPYLCGWGSTEDIASLAKSARNYNGVLTYAIGVDGSDIAALDKIAAAGGTTASYDITHDINQFSAKMADIRSEALGCDFGIPPPPNDLALDPNKVNFSYTPKGTGAPKILPRADDLVDCNGQPGWYYDSNTAPTKIVLCPASCSTVQADNNAKVSVLFGCKSVAK